MTTLHQAARDEIHLRVKGGQPAHQCASCEIRLLFPEDAVGVVALAAQKTVFYCTKCATFVNRGWKP